MTLLQPSHLRMHWLSKRYAASCYDTLLIAVQPTEAFISTCVFSYLCCPSAGAPVSHVEHAFAESNLSIMISSMTLQVEATTNHDVKAIEYVIKDRISHNAELAKVGGAPGQIIMACT